MGSHIFNRNLHEILGEHIYSARCDSLPKKRFREMGEGRLEELALVPAPLVELLGRAGHGGARRLGAGPSRAASARAGARLSWL